jgi:hypothetical protein
MEFLCALAISVAAMVSGVHTSNVIQLDAASRIRRARAREIPRNCDEPFWPEISSRYSLENPLPLNPDNSAKRALTEIALLFAVVGMLVLAMWAFLPGNFTP